MSFDEKRTWVYVVVSVVVYAAYLVVVSVRARNVTITEVAYAAPLLGSIGVAIVLTIVASIAVAIATKDRGKTDVRDTDIHRHGEYVGQIVFSACVSVPLLLALAEAKHFWIANSIYLGYIVSAVTSSAVKILAYRRGF